MQPALRRRRGESSRTSCSIEAARRRGRSSSVDRRRPARRRAPSRRAASRARLDSCVDALTASASRRSAQRTSIAHVPPTIVRGAGRRAARARLGSLRVARDRAGRTWASRRDARGQCRTGSGGPRRAEPRAERSSPSAAEIGVDRRGSWRAQRAAARSRAVGASVRTGSVAPAAEPLAERRGDRLPHARCSATFAARSVRTWISVVPSDEPVVERRAQPGERRDGGDAARRAPRPAATSSPVGVATCSS